MAIHLQRLRRTFPALRLHAPLAADRRRRVHVAAREESERCLSTGQSSSGSVRVLTSGTGSIHASTPGPSTAASRCPPRRHLPPFPSRTRILPTSTPRRPSSPQLLA